MIILGIAITVLTLVWKLITNYHKWLSAENVNHKKEWLIMALGNVPSIIVFTMCSKLAWYFAAPLSAAMIAFFIWLFFDGIYNLLRGFSVFFTGSDDEYDAATDNFLQAIPLWLHITIKVGGLAGLIILYILLK